MFYIDIPMKPISMNKAYVGTSRRRKSGEANRFYTDITDILTLKYPRIKKKFKEEFYTLPLQEYGLAFTIEVIVPEKKFFTAKKIDHNSKRGDIDNYIKLSQDALFKYLEVDDKYVISSSSVFLVSPTAKDITFRLKLDKKKIPYL